LLIRGFPDAGRIFPLVGPRKGVRVEGIGFSKKGRGEAMGHNRSVGMDGLGRMTLAGRTVAYDTDRSGDGCMVIVYDPTTGMVIATQDGTTINDAIHTLTLDVQTNGW
jgi:hypothetical protein